MQPLNGIAAKDQLASAVNVGLNPNRVNGGIGGGRARLIPAGCRHDSQQQKQKEQEQ